MFTGAGFGEESQCRFGPVALCNETPYEVGDGSYGAEALMTEIVWHSSEGAQLLLDLLSALFNDGAGVRYGAYCDAEAVSHH